jgi:hypothetical protein
MSYFLEGILYQIIIAALAGQFTVSVYYFLKSGKDIHLAELDPDIYRELFIPEVKRRIKL